MEGLLKIQYECIHLSIIVQNFSPIIHNRCQLRFTTIPRSLCSSRWAMIFVLAFQLCLMTVGKDERTMDLTMLLTL